MKQRGGPINGAHRTGVVCRCSFQNNTKQSRDFLKLFFSFHYTSQTRFDQSDLLINNLVFNVPLQKSKNLDFLIS